MVEYRRMPIKSKKKKDPICRIPLTAEEKRFRKDPTSIHELSWRIFRIMSEFVEGFQTLSETSKEVTFWGGTRIDSSSKWYAFAERLAKRCAKSGFTIITGGGPGIMEAGNKGAMEAGGVSVGFNIKLPREQKLNPYTNKGQTFHYFFSRKVVMASSAQAYVFFPGGWGTLDEFFEIVTLIETGKMEKTPVVCVGKEYWDGLFTWLKSTALDKFHALNASDFKLITITDSEDEVFKIISKSSERYFF